MFLKLPNVRMSKKCSKPSAYLALEKHILQVYKQPIGCKFQILGQLQNMNAIQINNIIMSICTNNL